MSTLVTPIIVQLELDRDRLNQMVNGGVDDTVQLENRVEKSIAGQVRDLVASLAGDLNNAIDDARAYRDEAFTARDDAQQAVTDAQGQVTAAAEQVTLAAGQVTLAQDAVAAAESARDETGLIKSQADDILTDAQEVLSNTTTVYDNTVQVKAETDEIKNQTDQLKSDVQEMIANGSLAGGSGTDAGAIAIYPKGDVPDQNLLFTASAFAPNHSDVKRHSREWELAEVTYDQGEPTYTPLASVTDNGVQVDLGSGVTFTNGSSYAWRVKDVTSTADVELATYRDAPVEVDWTTSTWNEFTIDNTIDRLEAPTLTLDSTVGEFPVSIEVSAPSWTLGTGGATVDHHFVLVTDSNGEVSWADTVTLDGSRKAVVPNDAFVIPSETYEVRVAQVDDAGQFSGYSSALTVNAPSYADIVQDNFPSDINATTLEGNSASDFASANHSHGATDVAIADSADNFTSTNVEGALVELFDAMEAASGGITSSEQVGGPTPPHNRMIVFPLEGATVRKGVPVVSVPSFYGDSFRIIHRKWQVEYRNILDDDDAWVRINEDFESTMLQDNFNLIIDPYLPASGTNQLIRVRYADLVQMNVSPDFNSQKQFYAQDIESMPWHNFSVSENTGYTLLDEHQYSSLTRSESNLRLGVTLNTGNEPVNGAYFIFYDAYLKPLKFVVSNLVSDGDDYLRVDIINSNRILNDMKDVAGAFVFPYSSSDRMFAKMHNVPISTRIATDGMTPYCPAMTQSAQVAFGSDQVHRLDGTASINVSWKDDFMVGAGHFAEVTVVVEGSGGTLTWPGDLIWDGGGSAPTLGSTVTVFRIYSVSGQRYGKKIISA